MLHENSSSHLIFHEVLEDKNHLSKSHPKLTHGHWKDPFLSNGKLLLFNLKQKQRKLSLFFFLFQDDR